MAHVTTAQAPFGAITVLRVVTAFADLRNAVLDWNDARVTRNALSRLSDAQLDDIGLTRGDLARM